MTDAAGLDSLRASGESQTVEFKSSFASREEIIDTLVAFANAFGGSVFVGVAPKPPHDVVGATVGSRTLEDFDSRLREKAGELPGFVASIIEHSDGKVVEFAVRGHRPGELFLSHGCAFIRASRSNQRMTVEQVRAYILDSPSVDSSKPRFKVSGGSTTNRPHEPTAEIARRVELVNGDLVESIEWKFRGTRISPRQDWQRAAIETRSNRLPGANLVRVVAKENPGEDDDEIFNAEFAILIRFRWRAELWYELHRFPLRNVVDIGREILPSLYRRGDGDWLDAS